MIDTECLCCGKKLKAKYEVEDRTCFYVAGFEEVDVSDDDRYLCEPCYAMYEGQTLKELREDLRHYGI